MEKNQLINKVYKIILSIITVVFGLIFILFALTIYFKGKEMIVDNPNYQIYTKEIVGKYLSYTIIPFIVWVLMIIGSYIIKKYYPYKEKNKFKVNKKITYNLLKKRIPNDDENYALQLKNIHKERKIRKIIFYIISILCLIFMIIAARYLFDMNNYSGTNAESIHKDTITMVLNVFPWIIGAFILGVGYLIYESISLKKEIVFMKEILSTYKGTVEKKETKDYKNYINITRICVLCISVIFIIYGALNGGPANVMHKAVELCMECVGLA